MCAHTPPTPTFIHIQTAQVPINEFDRAKALAGLNLDDNQFVDFCILCGCDYAGTIRGIGPIRALQLIQVLAWEGGCLFTCTATGLYVI